LRSRRSRHSAAFLRTTGRVAPLASTFITSPVSSWENSEPPTAGGDDRGGVAG
jgi:hypothetical protein